MRRVTLKGFDKSVSKVVAEPRSLEMVRYGRFGEGIHGTVPGDILLVRSALKGTEKCRQRPVRVHSRVHAALKLTPSSFDKSPKYH